MEQLQPWHSTRKKNTQIHCVNLVRIERLVFASLKVVSNSQSLCYKRSSNKMLVQEEKKRLSLTNSSIAHLLTCARHKDTHHRTRGKSQNTISTCHRDTSTNTRQLPVKFTDKKNMKANKQTDKQTS